VPGRRRTGTRVVWVDFENTPHVLFLEPFVRALLARGHDVRLTAKPQSQTLAVARARGLAPLAIGAGDHRSWSAKVGGGWRRAWALARWVGAQRSRPDLLLHCSRTASLAALALGVPAVGLLDYEHAIQWPLALASSRLWLPDLLREVRLPGLTRRVASFYEGLKENFYLDADVTKAGEGLRERYGVAPEGRLVVARPPAASAHYAAGTSWEWWVRAAATLARRPNVTIVVTARDELQRQRVAGVAEAGVRLRVLSEAVDGPALIAAADLVLGGGGTMNREAAVLGTHAWSTFCGASPRVDEALAAEGRLTWIRSTEDFERAMAEPYRRHTPRGPARGFAVVLDDILHRIE